MKYISYINYEVYKYGGNTANLPIKFSTNGLGGNVIFLQKLVTTRQISDEDANELTF